MSANTDDATQFEHEAETILDAEEQAELERINARRAELIGKNTQIIDEHGEQVTADVLIDEDDKPWPHGSLEYMGDVWEYRVPKPLAAMWLGTASRKAAKPEAKLNAIMGYLEHVLSPKSLERLHERANDHEDAFDVREMSELVRRTASEGSARPIGSTSS